MLGGSVNTQVNPIKLGDLVTVDGVSGIVQCIYPAHFGSPAMLAAVRINGMLVHRPVNSLTLVDRTKLRWRR